MKAGFYEREITPPLGSFIPGYFHIRLGAGVKERLYVKALAVENNDERFGIIILDSCNHTDYLFEKVRERVAEFVQLPKTHLLIGVTHSHTAVPLGRSDEVNPCPGDYEYMIKIAADTLTLAFQRLTDCTCRYGTCDEHEVAFVRNFKMKNGDYFTNPILFDPNIEEVFGKLDPQVSVLVFEDYDHKPIGSVTNFACHCDCVGGNKYSGDFPAILSMELKKLYGEEFVSVYMQGCAGNINHLTPFEDVDYSTYYWYMGKRLAADVEAVIKTAKPFTAFPIKAEIKPLALKRRTLPDGLIEDAHHSIETIVEDRTRFNNINQPDDPQIVLHYAKMLLERYEDVENPEFVETEVQVIRFGDCYFYGLPGEVFSQYGLHIKEYAPSSKVFISELACPGYHDYIPVPELMGSDNCYEGKFVCCTLAPQEGKRMADEAIALSKELSK